MYALSVRYICMSYQYALYGDGRGFCRVCMPCLCVISVCLISMPYMVMEVRFCRPCICARVRARERERESERASERERKRERERERDPSWPGSAEAACFGHVCLICMPYMHALYACLICVPCMHVLSVCLICVPCVCVCVCFCHVAQAV